MTIPGNNVSFCGHFLTRRPGVGDDKIYRVWSSEEDEFASCSIVKAAEGLLNSRWSYIV